MLLGIAGIIGGIALLVFWLMAIYTALTSQSSVIAQDRIIWFFIALGSAGLGSAAVFFAAGERKKGQVNFWIMVGLLVLLLATSSMSVVSFVDSLQLDGS